MQTGFESRMVVAPIASEMAAVERWGFFVDPEGNWQFRFEAKL
ncbi:MAG: hypothetical protein P4L99_17225 [Chthoniobacter sp.]|nr:hypothetical protein [Chthoniobacter sp.]